MRAKCQILIAHARKQYKIEAEKKCICNEIISIDGKLYSTHVCEINCRHNDL